MVSSPQLSARRATAARPAPSPRARLPRGGGRGAAAPPPPSALLSGLTRLLGGDPAERTRSQYASQVALINSFAPAVAALSDAGLRDKTAEFRARLAAGASLDALLPEAFAARGAAVAPAAPLSVSPRGPGLVLTVQNPPLCRSCAKPPTASSASARSTCS